MPNYTWRQFCADLRSGPFTSVGSYPTFFTTGDGCTVCHQCAREDALQGARDVRAGEQAAINGMHINWESELSCDGCSQPIEAAYNG